MGKKRNSQKQNKKEEGGEKVEEVVEKVDPAVEPVVEKEGEHTWVEKKEESKVDFGPEVGKTKGLTVWRIENMRAVEQKEFTGEFYTGDCYLLLHTIEVG